MTSRLLNFVKSCFIDDFDKHGVAVVMEHNLTSMNTSTNWYFDDPFILATQAQQTFYLNDMKWSVQWKVAHKVNQCRIFDIFEASDEVDGLLNKEVFQEVSAELPPFQVAEEVIKKVQH